MLKFSKIISFVLILLLAIPFYSHALETELGNFSVSAQHAYVYIPQLNTSIYEKAANERHAMASTTKIMTALVALENCELDRVVKITEEAVGIEGSSIYLKAGDEYYMKDLIYALLLQSANDAATAIAIEVGGSIEGFSSMMNEKAFSMNLKDTHFENPHGLDAKDHYTTARELALITAEALKNPTFKSIVSTYRKTISTVDGERVRTVVNHNKMLLLYDGAIGVKTGFTKKTGRCLVTAAEKDGLTIISVTLNAPSDWNDHTKMLNYGFDRYENRVLADIGELSYEIPVVNGDRDSVRCENNTEASVILKKGDQVTKKIELNRFVTAPIKKGEVLGHISFEYGNGKEIRVPLLASMDINEIKYKKGLFGFLNPSDNYG
ncbi:MAG: D-alanyl-D-alanine carboxypeptidase [Clostridia bacterium]|nr:D-alanyl-D-alanine carboxypeptidase [Clostridia bacterium]